MLHEQMFFSSRSIHFRRIIEKYFIEKSYPNIIVIKQKNNFKKIFRFLGNVFEKKFKAEILSE